jgi:colanic acid biosynthesis glycosyl transferase WcaI
MNVLLLALYFPPDWNGVSARAYNCARALLLEGCKVTVISAFPNYPDGHHSLKYKRRMTYSEEVDGINIIRTWVPNVPHSPLSRRIILYLSFMLSSLLGFRSVGKIDVIFSMNPSLFAFFPALMYSIFLRKKIIRNVDDLWPEVFYDMGIVRSAIFRKILDSMTRITYRIPKIIVPLSSGYVKTLTDKYQIPAEKIKVIEHGVDLQRFKQRAISKNYDSKFRKLVVYSGNISEAYDLELIVETARNLTEEPILFVIRGTGPNAEKIKSMINKYRLSNVEIRTNILSPNDLVSFLNNADIFLLPMNLTQFGANADKGLPTKTLEYQALGKPIICVSNGEAARYVSETKSGLVTSKRDPEELGNLILRLVNDENLAETLGKNGFDNIINNLTLEKIGKRFMEVINKTLQ